MKHIVSIFILSLILVILGVVGCTNQSDEYKYIEDTKVYQSESGVAVENHYPEYTKINAPTIKNIIDNNYFIEYYDLIDSKESAKLYSIKCELEKVNTLGNTYRYKPKYILKNGEETIELYGEVIELADTSMLNIMLSVKYESMLIRYNFYK